jgi:hypothetical protein
MFDANFSAHQNLERSPDRDRLAGPQTGKIERKDYMTFGKVQRPNSNIRVRFGAFVKVGVNGPPANLSF